jgi:hypothetical protein
MTTNHRTILLALTLMACAKENTTPGHTGGGSEETGGANATGGANTTGGANGTGGAKGTGGGPAEDAAVAIDSAVAGDTEVGSPDLAAPAEAGPARVLIYTKTNGTVHVSGIAGAVASFKAGLGGMGIMVDTANDPMVFTESNLARYAGVIMVSTSGTPFGTPGTTQIDALVAFVKKGGGLAGFHAASSTDYGPTGPFAALLGADTKDQGAASA